MSTTAATGRVPVRGPRRLGPDLAIAGRAFKQVWIGATVCAVAFGGSAAASALAYVANYPTEASRQQAAAAVSGDTGLAVLLGPVSTIDTVGGYAVYKNYVFLTTIGALWAVVAATRVLRGEEDTGRWQLVLAGSTRASRATAATLGALAAAVGVIFTGTTVLTLLAGRDPDVGLGAGGALLYGLSLAVPPAVFAVVGALASQLSRTRRTATGLGIAVVAVSFVLRMIADSGPGTRWLSWATPFGWTELMHPFTENDPWPLVPAVATVVGLGAAAVVLASRRDVGDGVLASRDVAPLRRFGLGSAFGMSARLELPVLAAWCAGATVSGLTLGILVKVTTGDVPASISDMLDRYGVHGSPVNQFLGLAFLCVATVVALLPAGQVGAACAEETSGRLVHILSRPTRRTAWFLGRLALCGAGIAAAGLLAGLATWLGAESQGVQVDLAVMLGAGLNVVPTALVALGIGAVLLSVAPRAAATTVYVVVTWSVFVDLAAPLASSLSWSDHLSLFHYMALVPGQDADPRAATVTVAVALLLCAAATILFHRRDVRST
ncbi:MAG: hypothetical protein IPM45_09415 [Acidimicrobiales bacterium]|nr:hypothetical protein [Acidimicrobiales bacterium]